MCGPPRMQSVQVKTLQPNVRQNVHNHNWCQSTKCQGTLRFGHMIIHDKFRALHGHDWACGNLCHGVMPSVIVHRKGSPLWPAKRMLCLNVETGPKKQVWGQQRVVLTCTLQELSKDILNINFGLVVGEVAPTKVYQTNTCTVAPLGCWAHNNNIVLEWTTTMWGEDIKSDQTHTRPLV